MRLRSTSIRAFAPCVGLALACCAPAPSPAPVTPAACPPPPPASVTTEPPARAPAPELVPRPTDRSCIVRGTVTRNDVTWRLRTRLDAVPTLLVSEGAVTAWIGGEPGTDGEGLNAVVEVENATMRVRARVAEEDLRAVLAAPLVALDAFVADLRTERHLVALEGDRLWVDVGMPGAGSTVLTLPCDALGLVRRDLDADALLPPPRGETTIAPGAKIRTGNGERPVAQLAMGHGSSVPRGVPATIRERRGGRTLVSIAACGGTVFGTVADKDVLGPSRGAWGSNFHCADTGNHVFLAARPLVRPRRCAAEVPLFVRTSTLEDAIGVLKANALFQVDGHERGATTLITIEAPAVAPLERARFAVRTRDLATCTDAPDGAAAPAAPAARP